MNILQNNVCNDSGFYYLVVVIVKDIELMNLKNLLHIDQPCK